MKISVKRPVVTARPSIGASSQAGIIRGDAMLKQVPNSGKKQIKSIMSFEDRFSSDLQGDGIRKMLIGPAEAEMMLCHNLNNRPVSQGVVQKYADRMKAGEWRYTRVPIIFSEDGRLIDGQHRLFAVSESGCSISVDVAFGAPDESFAFIDVGKKRSAGDIFAINGVPNAKACAAAMRWVWGYNNGVLGTVSGGGVIHVGPKAISEAGLYEEYLAHTAIQESAGVLRAFAKNRLAQPSMMMGIHYICSLKNRSQADDFFSKVGSGVGIHKNNDPALVLRNKLIDNAASEKKYSPKAVAGLTINAWNITRSGGSGRGLRYYPEKPFPKVR